MNRRVAAVLCAALFMGCREAKTPLGPPGSGLDVDPPVVLLRPAQDTTVDSVGVLNIRVTAVDQSNIKRVEFYLVGGLSGYPPVSGDSSVFSVMFPVSLGQYKHSSFGFYARVRDILDHETVTPTVIVTVR